MTSPADNAEGSQEARYWRILCIYADALHAIAESRPWGDVSGPKEIAEFALYSPTGRKSLSEDGLVIARLSEKTKPHGEGLMLVLSVGAAVFLAGFVKYCNEAKILPPDDGEALETSAWLEEIEAAVRVAMEPPRSPIERKGE